MIMEAGKSQNLQGESASWRPRRVAGIVPLQMAVVSKPRKSRAEVSVQAWRQEKTQCSSVKAVKQEVISDFGVYSDLRLIGWVPPTSGKAICFAHSTYLNVNPIQETLPEMLKIMSDQISVPLKLTPKISHHKCIPGFPGFTFQMKSRPLGDSVGWVSNFSSGRDLMVHEFEPHTSFWDDNSETGAWFGFCVPVSLPLPCLCFLSHTHKNK